MIHSANLLAEFLKEHTLPGAFRDSAREHFIPLASEIARMHSARSEPIVVGINGCQGSGKSTLADFLCHQLGEHHQLPTVALSIDDFYLTRRQRRHLAATVHPLLETRGVPGTHDIDLLSSTLADLRENRIPVDIPRFDKATDDRVNPAHWRRIEVPVAVIVLEGWCVGVPAQEEGPLLKPINALEARDDGDGRWRSWINHQLSESYMPLWAQLDQLIMLQAPGFECVYQWRMEQEDKLRERAPPGSLAIMSADQMQRFVAHYQRLTEHALLVLPDRVDRLFKLDAQRRIVWSSARDG